MKLAILLCLAFFSYSALAQSNSTSSSSNSTSTLCEVNLFASSNTSSDITNNTFVCSTSTLFNLTLGTAVIPANDIRIAPGEIPANDTLLLTFEKDGLTGTYNGDLTKFNLELDAGSAVGVTVAAEVAYDFDGDGTWDRTELYPLFALDPIPDEFQLWSVENTTGSNVNVTGNFTDLDDGAIRMRIWSPFGGSAAFLRIGSSDNATTSTSNISFPFVFSASNASSGSGGGASGGGVAACCANISDIRTELADLQERVDILSSRLANVTQNCCAGVSGTGATGTAATGTAAATATAVAASTGTATAAVPATAVGTVTAASTATVSGVATGPAATA